MAIVPFKDKRGRIIPSLYIREETGMFYFVKWIEGKTIQRSLKTTDPSVARSKLSDAELEYIESQKPKTAETLIAQKILDDHFNDYCEFKKSNERPATTRRRWSVYENSLEPFWANRLASDVCQTLGDEFMVWHRKNRPKNQFFNPLKCLWGFFDYMVEREIIKVSQRPKLVVPETEQGHHNESKGAPATEGEFRLLYKAASPRMKLMLGLAYRRGMRKMEIGALHKKQIKEITKDLFIQLESGDTKNKKRRTIPVPKEDEPLLRQFMGMTTGHLFPMKSDPTKCRPPQLIDKEWAALKLKVGITRRLRFHDLRHSAAKSFKVGGVNVLIASKTLGMSVRTYEKTYGELDGHDLMKELRKLGGSK